MPCSPAQVAPVVLEEPYQNGGIGEVLSGVAERLVRQRRRHAVEGVDEDVARILVRDLVIAELERRDAAADADIEPAMAEMVENADLLGEPQRRIERKEINERPEPDP